MIIQFRRVAVSVLCLAGLGLSLTSLHNHYAVSPTQYCDLNALFNCDIVNRSKYSELFGIPVSLIGALGYLALLGLTLRKSLSFELVRLFASLGGLAFALYLTYIEEFVLRTWCLLCIGSLIAIAGIVCLSFTAVGSLRTPSMTTHRH
jgi:uncharacterized membrane protein